MVWFGFFIQVLAVIIWDADTMRLIYVSIGGLLALGSLWLARKQLELSRELDRLKAQRLTWDELDHYR